MSMGMQVTTEEERNGEESGRSSPETAISSKMYFYGREFCFVLALLFTSYAALQNAPPKVSKSPLPVRFFPRTSLVADFYYGQLSLAFERVAESDVSFVMYYAPWDSESQTTKMQFSLVAQYFYKQVYFAAINCWQPLGECRQQFSKIQHFPVFIAYTQHTKGIQYKGLKTAPHMIKFLQTILRPLTRIERHRDLVNMMSSYDAVVLGAFDFMGSLGSPGFHVYYSTALKFLERDPQKEIGFAVVTNEIAAARLEIYNLPAVRLYMWNETLDYSQEAEYSLESLIKWISYNVHQITLWVSPPGVKSLTLSPYVEKGSVLMLFTPRNPLQIHNHLYDLMREVGLEYYNCNNNSWIAELSEFIKKKRPGNKQQERYVDAYCSLMNKNSYQSTGTHYVKSSAHWINTSQCRVQDRCQTDYGTVWNILPEMDTLMDGVPFPRLAECMKQDPLLDVVESYTSCGCQDDANENITNSSYDTSMISGFGDERSALSLITAAAYERCQMWHWARRIHAPVFPRSAKYEKGQYDIEGLACRSNQTLALLAMDSLHFHQFAEGLGLDILSYPDKTSAVIFNAELESTYILQESFSHMALIDFIVNYTKGTLSRNLRASHRQLSMSLNNYRELKSDECINTDSEVCIQELSSFDFENFVMAPDKNVVLFYHSPYCAICHSISYIYLIVARYFKSFHNLKFYRIDGENNDLPWEFTMDRYPTLLFFPAYRKSESRVFPQHLPMSVQNLVKFVLANLGDGLDQLDGLLALCSSWQDGQDNVSAKDCLEQICSKSVELISDTLSEYRTTTFRLRSLQTVTDTRRSIAYQQHLHKRMKDLLFKLQTLKEIHLLIGSVNRLEENSLEYVKIKNSLDMYRNYKYNKKSHQHTLSKGGRITDEL